MAKETKEDRVALITGCSTGIGRDLACRMSQAGFHVVATARRRGSLDGVDCALPLALDVTEGDTVRAAVGSVVERFGRIDILVNNAGYACRGAMEELPDEALRGMFDVNVFGMVRMLRAVARVMRAQGSGTIVNVSSLAGRVSMPANGGYSATKFAMEAMSDAARQELAPFGVRVVIVEPGPIATQFDQTMRVHSDEVLTDTSSPYRGLYERDAALAVSMRAGEPGPEAVSRVILRALRARHPKDRYVAAIPLAARLMCGMSTWLRDGLYASALARADV